MVFRAAPRGPRAYNACMPPENAAPDNPRNETPSSGPVAGVVIIVLLMLFGALYYWNQWKDAHKTQDQPVATSSNITEIVATTTIIATTTASTTLR